MLAGASEDSSSAGAGLCFSVRSRTRLATGFSPVGKRRKRQAVRTILPDLLALRKQLALLFAACKEIRPLQRSRSR